MTPATAPWICPACRAALTTPFCPQCGEELPKPHELTLRGVAEKLVHAFTSIDARVLRTTALLLRRPGELTVSWLAGVRKPYVAPFQLFLIANVIFFALQWATGTNIFSSSLDSHLHHQDWRDTAQSLVAQRLARKNETLAQFAPIFDRGVVLTAKSLIVLMTIPFALVLPLAFWRERAPVMRHVVFSLHLYTFLLIVFSAALLLAKLSELAGTGNLDAPRVDNALSALNLAACAAYLYLAIGPAYHAAGIARLLKAIALSIAVGAIVLGYRFVSFLITLYAA